MSMFPYVAPTEYGGWGDRRPSIMNVMTNTEKNFEEAADEVCSTPSPLFSSEWNLMQSI